MHVALPDNHYSKLKTALYWVASLTLIGGVFFLGLFLVGKNPYIQQLLNQSKNKVDWEIFGFAPYWSLSKMDKVDFAALTTFAYFSLPVNSDGSIAKNSHEYKIFEGNQLNKLFEKAKNHRVRRVITLTQMEPAVIVGFLANPDAWDKVANDSITIIEERELDGVNIDFEYIPSGNYLRNQFSKFIDRYVEILNEKLENPYITVSVLASSVRFNKIYDIGHLAEVTDGVFIMAYDYYYPGSKTAGPTAPLYGFNDGKGPFWYDVATAVEDFLTVASADKIIMGVAHYGWTYPVENPEPKSKRIFGLRAFATTGEQGYNDRLISTTPIGGWDNSAQVSWRGYWDQNGWHIVYLEDKKSLSHKYDFIKEKGLAGVGIWALGYDNDSTIWATLRNKFKLRLPIAYIDKPQTQL